MTERIKLVLNLSEKGYIQTGLEAKYRKQADQEVAQDGEFRTVK